MSRPTSTRNQTQLQSSNGTGRRNAAPRVVVDLTSDSEEEDVQQDQLQQRQEAVHVNIIVTKEEAHLAFFRQQVEHQHAREHSCSLKRKAATYEDDEEDEEHFAFFVEQAELLEEEFEEAARRQREILRRRHAREGRRARVAARQARQAADAAFAEELRAILYPEPAREAQAEVPFGLDARVIGLFEDENGIEMEAGFFQQQGEQQAQWHEEWEYVHVNNPFGHQGEVGGQQQFDFFNHWPEAQGVVVNHFYAFNNDPYLNFQGAQQLQQQRPLPQLPPWQWVLDDVERHRQDRLHHVADRLARREHPVQRLQIRFEEEEEIIYGPEMEDLVEVNVNPFPEVEGAEQLPHAEQPAQFLIGYGVGFNGERVPISIDEPQEL